MSNLKSTAKPIFWLVKSGERILGPFQTDEITRRLRSKEIVVIDEISAPRSRWHYVRDVPVFASVVEEIRRGLSASQENTEIQGYTSSVSQSAQTMITQTETDVEATVVPLNQTSVLSQPRVPNTPPVREAEFIDSPQAASARQISRTKDAGAKKFTLDESASQGPKPARRGAGALYIGGGVLIAAVIFAIYTSSKSGARNSSETVQPPTTETLNQFQTQAEAAWKRGEFDTALRLYREVEQRSPGSPEVATRLAALMIRLEGATVEAKRVLQAAKEKNPSPEVAQEIELALGLAALHSEEFTEAKEHLANAGKGWMASFNRGYTEFRLKNWRGAAQEFKAVKDQPAAYLMLARTALEAEKSGDHEFDKDGDLAISKAIGSFSDYKQEALVLGAVIDLRKNNRKGASARARAALDQDPEQTNDHFHSPMVAWEGLSWTQLLPACDELSRELKSTTERALQAVCLGKAGRLEEGSRLVEGELLRAPQDPLLHSVNAYLHVLANRDDAARASIKLASRATNPPKLMSIMSARLCNRANDSACAEEEWGRLASENPPVLAGLTQLAGLRFKKGDSETAGALLVKATSMSPTYLPLLRLREETASK